MYTYRNAKGALISTVCEISGGGWELVTEGEAKADTRAAKAKEPKAKKGKEDE